MGVAFYIAQALGILMTVQSIICMQFKSMRRILLCEILINVTAALNYAFLGGFSGMSVCALAIAQSLTIFSFTKRGRSFPLTLTICFMAGYLALSALTYQSPVDLLSCTASLAYALGIAQRKSSGYRLCGLFNCLLWSAYDLNTMAYTALITHVILTVSTVATILRLDRKEYCIKRSKHETDEGL